MEGLLMERVPSRIAFTCLLIVLLGSESLSQSWDTIPPPLGGGFVVSMARKGNVHYALHCESYDSLDGYGVALHESIDDGETWHARPMPSSATGWYNRLTIDSLGRLYYHDEDAVFRTTDRGTSWRNITAQLVSIGTIFQLGTDNTGRLYLLSSNRRLDVSENGGETWRTLTVPATNTAAIHIACVGNAVYLWANPRWTPDGVPVDTLYESTDQGETWSPRLAGIGFRAVMDGGGGKILLSQYSLREPGWPAPFRILSSQVGGHGWDTLFTMEALDVEVTPVAEQVLFRRSNQGTLAHFITDEYWEALLVTSVDGGVSWNVWSNPYLNAYSAFNLDARNRLLVYGGNAGFLRFGDFSAEHERIGFLPLALNLPPSVHPDGSILAASEFHSKAQICRWDPVTRSWSYVGGPPMTGQLSTFARWSTVLFSAPPDTMYAINALNANGIAGILARSTDMGRNWGGLIPAIRLSCANSSRASGRWFATSWDSIHVSSDRGRTWDAMASPETGPWSVAVEQEGYMYFLQGHGSALWRKSIGDTNWESRPIPWRGEAVVTGMEHAMFICRENGSAIARSSDGGVNWEQVSDGFGTVDELLALPYDTLISLDIEHGLAISPNRGDSWTLLDLASAEPMSMSMQDGWLYIGTKRLGILKTSLADVLATITPKYPPDSADCMPQSVVLRWDASTSLSGPYRVRCGTERSLWPGTLRIDTLVTGGSVRIGPLSPETRYYWDVSVERNGIGRYHAAVRDFRTTAIPRTSITHPIQDNACVAPNILLDWTAAECLDSSFVEVATDSAFHSIAMNPSFKGWTTEAALSLAYGTQYYARVRLSSGAGIGPWSDVVSFRTIDSILAAPLPSSPLNGAVLTALGTIVWTGPPCADRNEIIVSRIDDFSTDTIAHAFTQDPDNALAMLGTQWTNGIYYWKVRAWRDTVPGYWSPVWSFTLDDPVIVETAAATEGFGIQRIYPHPAGFTGGFVNVECTVPVSASADLIVCDLLGRERLRVPVAPTARSNRSLPIDISVLPSGQYLIILRGGSRSDVAPLLIAR
jgi:hypothetical protein